MIHTGRRAITLTLAFTALSLLLQPGCDQKESIPTPHPATQSTPPATSPSTPTPAHPTTESLLNGPRKRLVLASLPLVMEVPESWSIETPQGATIPWLVGPTPHGQVRILLTSQGTPFNAKTLELMDQQSQKDAAASGGKLQVTPLRSIGGTARARETRESRLGPVLAADGHSHQGQIMDWSIEVYVNQDSAYTLDLVQFTMLPLDLYQQDEDFLQQIVSTLHYDATRGLLQ